VYGECIVFRGDKDIHVHMYPWFKSVTNTGRVAKRVLMGMVNGYLTIHYYMDTDTDLIVFIPDNKLIKYPYISYLIT